ncbi:MAG: hypothetical protein AAF934_04670 [Bacteroidota bacterium]
MTYFVVILSPSDWPGKAGPKNKSLEAVSDKTEKDNNTTGIWGMLL